MTDGITLQNPPVAPPETSQPVPSPPLRFAAAANGIPDTSGPGPVMLQQPSRWSHDFDPDTGISRASLPAETPLFFNIPSAPTPPQGDSSQNLATTEWVHQQQVDFIADAVRQARLGITDGSGAAPGQIGEFLRINMPPPGAQLTSGQFLVLQVIELSPGDWEVYASTGFQGPSGVNAVNTFYATTVNDNGSFSGFGGTNTASVTCNPLIDTNLNVAYRLNIVVPTSIFQMAFAQWTGSAAQVFAYGCLTATRVR